jgi:hypothetical protein
MPIAVVDSIATDDTFCPSGTPTAISFASTIGAGEAEIVGIICGSTISAITDNSAGTPALTLAYTNGSVIHFYYRVNVSGSPSAINLTLGANDTPFVCVWRVSGIDNATPEDSAGDTAFGDTGEGNVTSHSVNVANANSGSLIVGLAYTDSFLDRTWTGGTGVTVTVDPTDVPSIFGGLARVAPSAGPTAVAWTFDTARACNAGFTAFNAAAGGGGAVIPGASSYYRRLRA